MRTGASSTKRRVFVAAIHQLAIKLEHVQERSDHAHWKIMQELKECRNKFTQVHYALSDVIEMLGLTKKTMQDANETIQQLRERPQDTGAVV